MRPAGAGESKIERRHRAQMLAGNGPADRRRRRTEHSGPRARRCQVMELSTVEIDGPRRSRRMMASVDEQPAFAVVGRVGVAEPADPQIVVVAEARHGQALFGFVRRLGLSDEQAHDCVQEVLLRLWSELDRGVTVTDPKGWLFRAVYRVAMDEHRFRRRVAGLVALLGGRASLQKSPVDDVDRIAVWTEVDRLPARQRQVLYLRYRADLPFDEIAEILGMTASAARSHSTQATATLRRRLSDDVPREKVP